MSETFRQSIRPYFESGLFSARMFAVLGGVLLLVTAWPDLNVELLLFATVFVCAAALLFVAILTALGVLISLIWAVEVGPQGITASTFLGWRASASWEEIESVEWIDVNGVPYLALSRRGRRLRVYVPAEMQRGRRFDELVLQYAGRSHPLADWLLPDAASVNAA